jgi:hypothetical protein
VYRPPTKKDPIALRQKIHYGVDVGLGQNFEHLLHHPLRTRIRLKPVVYYSDLRLALHEAVIG